VVVVVISVSHCGPTNVGWHPQTGISTGFVVNGWGGAIWV
jgi:hypothetical protein